MVTIAINGVIPVAAFSPLQKYLPIAFPSPSHRLFLPIPTELWRPQFFHTLRIILFLSLFLFLYRFQSSTLIRQISWLVARASAFKTRQHIILNLGLCCHNRTGVSSKSSNSFPAQPIVVCEYFYIYGELQIRAILSLCLIRFSWFQTPSPLSLSPLFLLFHPGRFMRQPIFLWHGGIIVTFEDAVFNVVYSIAGQSNSS